jgi:CRISPR-associated protein Cas2
MVVLILEKVPPGLRGELTRWYLEPKTGVFVGRVSARVRDKLWEKSCRQSRGGSCTMIYRSNTEQGFRISIWGRSSKILEDYEGLLLFRTP